MQHVCGVGGFDVCAQVCLNAQRHTLGFLTAALEPLILADKVAMVGNASSHAHKAAAPSLSSAQSIEVAAAKPLLPTAAITRAVCKLVRINLVTTAVLAATTECHAPGQCHNSPSTMRVMSRQR